MARPIPDMDQMTAAEVAVDDSIIIDDTSAGETKRINVGALLGIPLIGWTSAGEVHTFASWDSATGTGVINVPSNATTKYQLGNRYRLTQATGGTKYAIIHGITTTTLTLFFPVGTTLNNETISNPYYSQLDSPIGFDKDPVLWTLVNRKTTRTTQGAGTNTYYNIGGSLAINTGKWKLSAADLGLITHNAAGYMGFTSVLSTASSGTGGNIPDSRMRSAISQGTSSEIDDQYEVWDIPFTATGATTIYLNRAASSGSGMTLYSEQTADQYANGTNFIKALSAYL